jgi:hypothetical protein
MWIICPPSPPFLGGFSLARIPLIFSMRLRQQIQTRSVTLVLAKNHFHSMYPPIVCHVSFPPPRHTRRSFYQSLIQLHSTFSSTGCISDVPNTSKIASTGELFSCQESREMSHTWVCQMTLSVNFSVAGSAPGQNATYLHLLPMVTTLSLQTEKITRTRATKMWMWMWRSRGEEGR